MHRACVMETWGGSDWGYSVCGWGMLHVEFGGNFRMDCITQGFWICGGKVVAGIRGIRVIVFYVDVW